MIEIVATPPLNTIQDLGRFGARHHGVGCSGAMDALALVAANALLGNREDAAAIEIQTFPFVARFVRDTTFALTGADAQARLDGAPVPPWWTASARAGQSLALDPPRIGARAYLALAGGFDAPFVLGSRSTHLRSGFGGLDGRALRAGDILRAAPDGARRKDAFGLVPPQFVDPPAICEDDPRALALRVIRAGDHDLFPPDMQQRFWRTSWKISRHSDRAGYRLSGPPLLLPAPVELRSYGLLSGIIQVPPSGEPIIQLADANTAGGYPKIAAVIDADLWRLAQAQPGSFLRFVEVDHAVAAEATQKIDAYLAAIRKVIELGRMQ